MLLGSSKRFKLSRFPRIADLRQHDTQQVGGAVIRNVTLGKADGTLLDCCES